MSKEKRNFRIKMNMVASNDDLRPIMSNIYFDNGFMVATDAHVLIKAAVMHFSDFDQSEVEILNGKMIHKNTFKKILSIEKVQITEDGIVDLATQDVYKFSSIEGKYPNFEAVIPKQSGSIEEIGITPAVAAKLFKTLSTTDIYNLKMVFTSQNGAITLKSTGDVEGALTAILMPAMINN